MLHAGVQQKGLFYLFIEGGASAHGASRVSGGIAALQLCDAQGLPRGATVSITPKANGKRSNNIAEFCDRVREVPLVFRKPLNHRLSAAVPLPRLLCCRCSGEAKYAQPRVSDTWRRSPSRGCFAAAVHGRQNTHDRGQAIHGGGPPPAGALLPPFRGGKKAHNRG